MKSKIDVLRGFTLIEIIVVVAVIGLLAVVAMASFSQARANSRDKARVSDLEQAKAAMHIYAATNGTYHIPNTGDSGAGQGWFGGPEEGVPKSTAQVLVDLELMSVAVHDPLVPETTNSTDGHQQYMIYFTAEGPTSGVCLFAQLENPTEDQVATFTAAPINSTTRSYLNANHTMNYATCTE